MSDTRFGTQLAMTLVAWGLILWAASAHWGWRDGFAVLAAVWLLTPYKYESRRYP